MVQIVIDDQGTMKLTQQILAGMPQKIKQVIRRASVDTVRAVKAEIPRAINQRYALTKSAVRSHMRLTTKSEDGGMITGLIITGKRIPVMDFEVTPKEPPVQRGVPVSGRVPVRIVTVRSHPKVGQPNRFIAKMKSGHIGVFRRTHRAKSVVKTAVERIGAIFGVEAPRENTSLPIAESMSESVPEMIRVKEIRKQIEDRASEVLTKSIERNIKAVLKR